MLQLGIKLTNDNSYKVTIKVDNKKKSMKQWAALINELVNNTENLTKAIGQELSKELTEEQEMDLAQIIVKMHEASVLPDNRRELLNNAKKPSVPPKIMINRKRETE